MDDIVIHGVGQESQQVLEQISVASRSDKPAGYFDVAFERAEQGLLNIYTVCVDEMAVGYCFLNFGPKYSMFSRLKIPEIQDLNVLPDFRRCGYGFALIEHCETFALGKGFGQMGISVGLDGSYGAAQRLYAKMGYVPDGNGVTYDRMPVSHGDRLPVDDDLCLMLIKDLAKTAA